MEYKKFIEKMVEVLSERIDRGYYVQIQKILKNNGVELDGIMIMQEGQVMVPNLYLNHLFSRYEKGMSMEELADEIVEKAGRKKCSDVDEQLKNLEILEEQRNYIIYRIVNYEYNQKFLQSVPFIRFLDLAITFHCLVKQEEDGIGTICVTDDLAKKWEVSNKDLFCIANENTARLFPIVIKSMESVLKGIVEEEESYEYTLKNIEENSSTMDIENAVQTILYEEPQGMPMFILTNSMGINGASVLLYKDILKRIALQCHTDLFILPSSIHEVIIVPNRGGFQREQLENMVKEINDTQVAVDEVLSNHVYLYKRNSDSFA